MEIKKNKREFLFPRPSLFGMKYREWHLWASFRIHRTTDCCPPARAHFLSFFFPFSLLRSRFYQLERLYTHIFLSSCVPDFFFARLGLSTSWKVTRLFLLFLLLPLCPTTPMSKSFRQQKKRTTFVSLTLEKNFFPSSYGLDTQQTFAILNKWGKEGE